MVFSILRSTFFGVFNALIPVQAGLGSWQWQRSMAWPGGASRQAKPDRQEANANGIFTCYCVRRRAWSPRWRARQRCRARPGQPQTQSLTRRVRRPTVTTCLRQTLSQMATRVLRHQRRSRMQGWHGVIVVWGKRELAQQAGRLHIGAWECWQSH